MKLFGQYTAKILLVKDNKKNNLFKAIDKTIAFLMQKIKRKKDLIIPKKENIV